MGIVDDGVEVVVVEAVAQAVGIHRGGEQKEARSAPEAPVGPARGQVSLILHVRGLFTSLAASAGQEGTT